MSLFLDPFELSKQKFASINKVRSVTFLKEYLVLFLCQVTVNGVIDGKAFNSVDVFDEFETHGASYSSVPEIRKGVHEEFVKAGSTEGMAAMNEDSWDIGLSIVVFFAELTSVLVDKFSDKLFDFWVFFVGDVFGLSKEEGGWVFEFFHSLYFQIL
jgi:hypothetical protein